MKMNSAQRAQRAMFKRAMMKKGSVSCPESHACIKRSAKNAE